MSPLIQIFASFLALGLAAQSGPAADPDLEPALAQAWETAADAFLKGEPVLPLAQPAGIAMTAECAGRIEAYEILRARISYIQAGRDPEDSPEAFAAMIRHVAESVRVDGDEAVALYKDRVRGQGGVAGQDASPGSLRAALIEEMLGTEHCTPEMQKELQLKLARMERALMGSLRDAVASAAAGAVPAVRLPVASSTPSAAPAVPASLKIKAPPAAKAAARPKADLRACLDPQKAANLAKYVWSHAVGFTHRCYAYVYRAVKSVLGWDSRIGAGSAYQFAKSINRNPKLMDKLKLRKIDPRSLPGGVPPVGAIVVYGRGMCGFSRTHGHIEIVVSSDPPKACSDGCMPMTRSRLQCIQANSPKGYISVYVPVRSPAGR